MVSASISINCGFTNFLSETFPPQLHNNATAINNIYAFAVFGAEDIVMKDNVYRGHPLNGNWVVAHNTENIVLDITK